MDNLACPIVREHLRTWKCCHSILHELNSILTGIISITGHKQHSDNMASHRDWAFFSRARMLCSPARLRTSVSGIMSASWCEAICAGNWHGICFASLRAYSWLFKFRRHRGEWSWLQLCRLSALFGDWVLVVPTHSYEAFRKLCWLWHFLHQYHRWWAHFWTVYCRDMWNCLQFASKV